MFASHVSALKNSEFAEFVLSKYEAHKIQILNSTYGWVGLVWFSSARQAKKICILRAMPPLSTQFQKPRLCMWI